jgi:hypothetical protein
MPPDDLTPATREASHEDEGEIVAPRGRQAASPPG